MPELLDELKMAKIDSTLHKLIKAYQKVDLFIIDEWLIRCLTEFEKYDLLEIVEARGNSPKGSIIFCTQYNDEEWYGWIDVESEEESSISEVHLNRLLLFEFGLRHHSHYTIGGFFMLSSSFPLTLFAPA